MSKQQSVEARARRSANWHNRKPHKERSDKGVRRSPLECRRCSASLAGAPASRTKRRMCCACQTAYMAEWRNKNRERWREIANNGTRVRRERMAAAGKLEPWVYPTVLAAYGTHCLRCDAPGARPDHVIPISRGGTNNVTNFQPLCDSCNFKKHTSTKDYRTPTANIRLAFLASMIL